MDLIIGERQTGRTTKLIRECASHKGSVIICPNIHMADYTYKIAKDIGIEIERPISFHSFCHDKYKDKKYTGFYFDDLDICLKVMANNIPVYAAATELNRTEILSLK